MFNQFTPLVCLSWPVAGLILLTACLAEDACTICACNGTEVNCAYLELELLSCAFPADTTKIDASGNLLSFIRPGAVSGLANLTSLCVAMLFALSFDAQASGFQCDQGATQ